MKISAILLCVTALLPSALSLTVKILAPDRWKDVAMVSAKRYSEGEIEDMTRATHNPGSAGICAQSPFNLATAFDCDDQYKYYGITTITFENPTVDPRPITVTFPDYILDCKITVTQVDAKNADWYTEWGLNNGAEEGAIKLLCSNTTNTG